MSDIFSLILLALLVVGIVALFFIPVMALMFFTNKRQRKYFSRFAQEYGLEEHLGTKKIRRDFPLVKGNYNNRWNYVKAATVGQLSWTLRTVNLKYSTPAIKMGVQLMRTDLEELTFETIKYPDGKSDVRIDEFDEYFEIKISPPKYKELIFRDELRKEIIEYYKEHYILNFFVDDNNFLVTNLLFEATTKKRYKQLVQMIELMRKVAGSIPQEG